MRTAAVIVFTISAMLFLLPFVWAEAGALGYSIKIISRYSEEILALSDTLDKEIVSKSGLDFGEDAPILRHGFYSENLTESQTSGKLKDRFIQGKSEKRFHQSLRIRDIKKLTEDIKKSLEAQFQSHNFNLQNENPDCELIFEVVDIDREELTGKPFVENLYFNLFCKGKPILNSSYQKMSAQKIAKEITRAVIKVKR